MTAQQLKNSILQMAVQGKLVPQNPDDERASVLLERIRAEKEALIKVGKIKREKNPSVIFRGADGLPYEKVGGGEPVCITDEVPFEIPDSWEWCRLGTVMVNRDAERIPLSVSEREKLDKIYDYYGASGVIDKVDKFLFNKPLLLIGEDGANLLLRSKPIAFIATGEYWVNNHAHVLDTVGGLSMKYICWYINAINLAPYVTGTAQPKMNQEKMNSILVPIPPIQEQHRIVAKIEELLPCIAKYDQAESQLAALNAGFPAMLKKSILQEAVQGRLVPQNPDDESAAALLERIRKEKARLVREGKIKRGGGGSVIFRRDGSHYERLDDGSERCIDDEVPFEIPEGWEWCRLGNITAKEIKRGKSPVYADKSFVLVFAQKCNAKYGRINLSLAKFLDESVISKYPRDEYMQDSDIVVNSTGTGTLGRVGFYTNADNPNRLPIVPDSHVTVVRVNNDIAQYIYYVLKYYQSFLEECGEGSTKQKELKADKIKELLIPLPPLAEQKRIVAKIEELMRCCEML